MLIVQLVKLHSGTHQARIFGQILPIFAQISAKKWEIWLKIGEIRHNSSSQKIPGLMSYAYPTVTSSHNLVIPR